MIETKMNLARTVKQYTFFRILRAIFAIPAYIYLVGSYFFTLKPELIKGDIYPWYWTASIINGVCLTVGLLLIVIMFILWRLDIYKY